MRRHFRWFTFELTKLAIVLGLFTLLQQHIVDTRYEALAQTNHIAHAQVAHVDKILELEDERDRVTLALAESSARVETIAGRVEDFDDTREQDQESLHRLIIDQKHEIRSMIADGIERIETTATTNELTENVATRVEQLENAIELRRPSIMKHRMIFPVVQLRGNGTVGSGVVVHSARNSKTDEVETYILTAYHVIQEILEGAPGSIVLDDARFLNPLTDDLQEEPFSVRLEAFHVEADIALLSADLPEPWPYVAKVAAPARIHDVSIFERVYAVGCPLGNKPMPTNGEVSSKRKMVDGHNFWMVNAPTFFGNSGGGVYLVDSGELIGISSMIYTYGKRQPMVVPHMGLFIPMNAIRDWLSDCQEETAQRAFSSVFKLPTTTVSGPESADVESAMHLDDE